MANNNETTAGDELVSAATEKLLGDSDIVSSEDTNIEEHFSESIAGIEAGQEAGASRLEKKFERESGYLKEAGARRFTSAQESQRGFATNRALLSQISEETEKSVRDLDMRKEELILAGESAAAAQISNLQIQQLQFEQQSKQQIFSNLLAMAGFGLQTQAGERAQEGLDIQREAQDFAENSAISAIALEFGLEIGEDETLDSITGKAKATGLVSEERAARLDLLKAQTAQAKAETAKALRGDKFILDSVTASAISGTIDNLFSQDNPVSIKMAETMLGAINEQYGAEGMQMVASNLSKMAAEEFESENMSKNIEDEYNNNTTLGQVIDKIDKNPWATNQMKEDARAIANDYYAKKQKEATKEYLTKKSDVDPFKEAANPITGILGLLNSFLK